MQEEGLFASDAYCKVKIHIYIYASGGLDSFEC